MGEDEAKEQDMEELLQKFTTQVSGEIKESHETLSGNIGNIQEQLTKHSSTVNANIESLEKSIDRVEKQGTDRDKVIFDDLKAHETRLSTTEERTKSNRADIQVIQAARASSATIPTGERNGKYSLKQIGVALTVAVPAVGGLLYYVITAVIEGMKASS